MEAFIVILIGLYFVPTIVGVIRKVPNIGSVIVINLLLGWSLVGWAVALAMASRSVPAAATQNVYIQTAVVPPHPAQAPPAPAAPGVPTFTHSGERYVLGYSADSCGIWDKEHPGPPIQRFPKDEQGWHAAWQRFAVLEPQVAGSLNPPELPSPPSS